MTSQRYRVVFEGEIVQGQDVEEVKKKLAALCKVSDEKIEKYFQGRPMLIRSDVDYQTAVKYQTAFRSAGAVCIAEPIAESHPGEIEEAGLDRPGTVAAGQTEKMDCPKCGTEQDLADECVSCGVVVQKYLERTSSPSAPVTPEQDQVEDSQRAREASQHQSISAALKIAMTVAVVGGLCCMVFFWFVESRLDARNFTDSLGEFGAREIDIPHSTMAVSMGQIPYRLGKVLVVMPEHTLWIYEKKEENPATIHPTWFKLSRSMRASKPEEVDTLIRITKDLRGARLYMSDIKKDGLLTKTKVVDNHRLIMEVYNWQDQTYIGNWIFDPGDFKGEVMTEDELDEMAEATSSATVAEFIKSMPER
jgi:hypothetical protein